LKRVIAKAYEGDAWDEAEELQIIETREWINRGDRVHVSVKDIGLPTDTTSH